MIDITQHGWHWPVFDDQADTRTVDVWASENTRVSALLGPDGEPLKVGYERPRLGFDLTPRGQK